MITVDGFDHSGGLHLQCESEGWYPEPVLEWLNSEGVLLSPETREKHRNTKGFQCETNHHCTSQGRQDSLQSQTETSHPGDSDYHHK